MRNTERIVRALRTDPKADVSAMTADDASAVLAKLVTTTHIPFQREILIGFVREVHHASATVVRREHTLRTEATLDAADARARLNAANRRLKRAGHLFEALDGTGEPLTPEEAEQVREELIKILKPVPLPPAKQ